MKTIEQMLIRHDILVEAEEHGDFLHAAAIAVDQRVVLEIIHGVLRISGAAVFRTDHRSAPGNNS